MCQLYIDMLLVSKTKFRVHCSTGEERNNYIGICFGNIHYINPIKKRKKRIFAKNNAAKWLFLSDFFKGRFLSFFLKVDCMYVFSRFALFSWFSIQHFLKKLVLVNSLSFLVKQILDIPAKSSLLPSGEMQALFSRERSGAQLPLSRYLLQNIFFTFYRLSLQITYFHQFNFKQLLQILKTNTYWETNWTVSNYIRC